MILNGWQRIGVAAFAVWAAVAFVGFWVAIHEGANWKFEQCSSFYKILWFDAPDRAEKMHDCLRQATEISLKYSETATTNFWRYVALVITLPALFVWGMISLVIVTGRWIRGGFRVLPTHEPETAE